MCTVESGTLAFIKDNKITNYQECGPDMCELYYTRSLSGLTLYICFENKIS